MKKKKVLLGCEESGAVRRAFRSRGHDAWSNDLKPARDGDPHHIQEDVIKAIQMQDWDIIILHPPCDALALSGNRWYAHGKPKHEERLAAIEWTKRLWFQANLAAKTGVALENPMSVLWPHVLNYIPDTYFSYLQPWQFGHGETKKTGILRRGLPALKPTNVVDGREKRVWRMPPGPNRKRDRSETYAGVAEAMAQQWGDWV